MKISNSKKQLAKIIHENGGWRDGAGFAAQDRNASVTFFVDAPWRCETSWEASEFEALSGFGVIAKSLPNWHQTILSRDEYFYLYQEQGLESALDEPMPEAEPTIEQLAADYRNRKDYADRKQQEADAAKADAETKLAELVAAGKALGLVLSVAGVELVITDWRDLQVGDIIWWGGDEDNAPGEYEVEQLEDADYDGYLTIAVGSYWVHYESDEWRFIRRPAQGEADA